MLTARLSASVSFAWVVLAGCEAMLRVSPRLAVSDSIFKLFKKSCPAFRPPFSSKQTIPPPSFICFFAFHVADDLVKKGNVTMKLLAWSSSDCAIYKAFSACRCIRTSSVSKLLLSTHALKGDIDGPVLRQKRYISLMSSFLPTITPPNTRPCPSIHLVAECTTRSAPKAIGC